MERAPDDKTQPVAAQTLSSLEEARLVELLAEFMSRVRCVPFPHLTFAADMPGAAVSHAGPAFTRNAQAQAWVHVRVAAADTGERAMDETRWNEHFDQWLQALPDGDFNKFFSVDSRYRQPGEQAKLLDEGVQLLKRVLETRGAGATRAAMRETRAQATWRISAERWLATVESRTESDASKGQKRLDQVAEFLTQAATREKDEREAAYREGASNPYSAHTELWGEVKAWCSLYIDRTRQVDLDFRKRVRTALEEFVAEDNYKRLEKGLNDVRDLLRTADHGEAVPPHELKRLKVAIKNVKSAPNEVSRSHSLEELNQRLRFVRISLRGLQDAPRVNWVTGDFEQVMGEAAAELSKLVQAQPEPVEPELTEYLKAADVDRWPIPPEWSTGAKRVGWARDCLERLRRRDQATVVHHVAENAAAVLFAQARRQPGELALLAHRAATAKQPRIFIEAVDRLCRGDNHTVEDIPVQKTADRLKEIVERIEERRGRRSTLPAASTLALADLAGRTRRHRGPTDRREWPGPIRRQLPVNARTGLSRNDALTIAKLELLLLVRVLYDALGIRMTADHKPPNSQEAVDGGASHRSRGRPAKLLDPAAAILRRMAQIEGEPQFTRTLALRLSMELTNFATQSYDMYCAPLWPAGSDVDPAFTPNRRIGPIHLTPVSGDLVGQEHAERFEAVRALALRVADAALDPIYCADPVNVGCLIEPSGLLQRGPLLRPFVNELVRALKRFAAPVVPDDGLGDDLFSRRWREVCEAMTNAQDDEGDLAAQIELIFQDDYRRLQAVREPTEAQTEMRRGAATLPAWERLARQFHDVTVCGSQLMADTDQAHPSARYWVNYERLRPYYRNALSSLEDSSKGGPNGP